MARTDGIWEVGEDGTYIELPDGGYNVLINGINRYLNFNSIVGSSGYGIRDFGGIMQWKNSGGTWANIGSGGGGGQTPWTSNIDAGGFNLFDLGNIEFNGDGLIQGYTQTLGSTSHTGSGLNNITISGNQTTYGAKTYTYTVTSLNGDIIRLGFISGGTVNVGDAVTFVHSSTTVHSTILSVTVVSGNTFITIATPSSTLSTSFSFTDNTTGATSSVTQVAPTDLGTFTDGTTVLTSQALTREIPIINGVTLTASTSTGHTLGDSWSASVTQTLSTLLELNGLTGMMNTPLALDSSSATAPTFSALSAGGVVGATGTGQLFIENGSVMAIGNSIGGAINNSVLYTDSSGNLDGNSDFYYINATGASFFQLAFPSSSFGNYIYVNDNNATIQIGNSTSGYIIADGNAGGTFVMSGSAVGITDLTGNQFFYSSPSNGSGYFGDIPELGFGGILNFNGQNGDIYFGTITGTKYADFDMMNGIYTIGNPFGIAPFANVLQINQSNGQSFLTGINTIGSTAMVTVTNSGLLGTAILPGTPFSTNYQQGVTTSISFGSNTTPHTSTYQVNVWAAITAVSGQTLSLNISWTDENGNSQTQILYPLGASVATLSTVKAYPMPVIPVKALTGTSIQLNANVAGVGSIAYDIEIVINDLNA